MLKVRSYDFARDELGGGTIMGLLWFILLVGITGLAVDISNGFRNRTMLQATADAAALGGAVDLPNDAAVVASAVAYSAGNMPVAMYGDVLQPGDVDLGARDMGVNGINVQAGGDINLTSNNMFGLCSGGAPNLFTVAYYRLVR